MKTFNEFQEDLKIVNKLKNFIETYQGKEKNGTFDYDQVPYTLTSFSNEEWFDGICFDENSVSFRDNLII